jgi:hypothetical protein
LANTLRHSGARAKPASPESIVADLWLWIPDLPLRGNPQ